jgi:hypothetical protein
MTREKLRELLSKQKDNIYRTFHHLYPEYVRQCREKNYPFDMDEEKFCQVHYESILSQEWYFSPDYSIYGLTTTTGYTLPQQQRMEHHWIVAAPGSGKTQMLQAMIADDIEHGRTVFVMDSQRDMIQKLASLKHGMETILIDPKDIEFPPAIALFDIKIGDEAEENTLIELYQYVFSSLLSAGLTLRQDVLFTYVLRLVFTLNEANIFTLLDIFKNGEDYRREMSRLEQVERDFFSDEYFEKYYNANKTQIIQRLHGILKNKTFRRIFANTQSKIKFQNLINKPCVILVNTSKAQLGDEGSAIFGRFILSLLTMAIYQRAKIPESKRRPIYLYIDEGGDYGNDSAFTKIISQCRKYKAGLIFCNQYLGQLSPDVLGAMMSCAIKCVSSLEDPTETKKMSNSLRVQEDFIRNLRKDKEGAQWALYVRGGATMHVKVPFGILEAKEKRADYDRFIQENRVKYCVTPSREVTGEVIRRARAAGAQREGITVEGEVKEVVEHPHFRLSAWETHTSLQ